MSPAFNLLLNCVRTIRADGYQAELSLCYYDRALKDYKPAVHRTTQIEDVLENPALLLGIFDEPTTLIRARIFSKDGEDDPKVQRRAYRTYFYNYAADGSFSEYQNADAEMKDKTVPIDEFQSKMAEIITQASSVSGSLLDAKIECAELRAENKRLDIRCRELEAQRNEMAEEVKKLRAEKEIMTARIYELEKEPTGLNGFIDGLEPTATLAAVADIGKSFFSYLTESKRIEAETRTSDVQRAIHDMAQRMSASQQAASQPPQYGPAPDSAFNPEGYVDESNSFNPNNPNHAHDNPQS